MSPQLMITRCGQARRKLWVQSGLSSVFFLLLLIGTGCQQLQIAERPAEVLQVRPIVKSLPDAPVQLQQLVDGAVAQAGIRPGMILHTSKLIIPVVTSQSKQASAQTSSFALFEKLESTFRKRFTKT
jgi:hypothetical protein